MISLSRCKKRRVYKLLSRNLLFAVFDGETRFIGIRTKFGSRFLDTEDHWDTGPPFGTARPEEDTGVDIPEDIILRVYENEGNPVDKITGRSVAFDKPISEGGKGWFFTDTGESGINISPTYFENKLLFAFLDKFTPFEKAFSFGTKYMG